MPLSETRIYYPFATIKIRAAPLGISTHSFHHRSYFYLDPLLRPWPLLVALPINNHHHYNSTCASFSSNRLPLHLQVSNLPLLPLPLFFLYFSTSLLLISACSTWDPGSIPQVDHFICFYFYPCYRPLAGLFYRPHLDYHSLEWIPTFE